MGGWDGGTLLFEGGGGVVGEAMNEADLEGGRNGARARRGRGGLLGGGSDGVWFGGGPNVNKKVWKFVSKVSDSD